MAQAAPTSIPLPPVQVVRAPARETAWTVAWTIATPALRLLGRALAPDYDRDAERAADLRAARR